MMDFILYEANAAVILLIFYLFYRALLKKETFHRFNRIVLVGTAIISFVLPFCIITVNVSAGHLPLWLEPAVAGATAEVAGIKELQTGMILPAEGGLPWWQVAFVTLYWAGVAYVFVRIVISVLSISRIIRSSVNISNEDGCMIFVTEHNIDPFSWMKFIVISSDDWKNNHTSILTHEKAHIGYRHSIELLAVDIMAAFQWFNPAIWMLRADLKDLHEYEADDAVLRSETDIKEYQYLLIRKAVGKSGYSVANSFNHSILKKRITMMSKSKSPLLRKLRLLYVLPLVCLCLGLQAQTISESSDKNNQKNQPLYILRYAWGEEKQISKAELDAIQQHRISSIKVLKDAEAKEKYGEKAANGVIIINMKIQQELDKLIVVSYKQEESNERVPFYILEPDTMPSFQGQGMEGFSKWLFTKLYRPEGCKHHGNMKVSFVIGKDGAVKDIKIMDSVCAELDEMVVSIIGKSPKWEPAMLNGKPVEQFIHIPISFEMR